MRGFLRELKHRRVYRVALAYGVVASGLVQIGGTILPIFHAPEWVQQLFVVLIAVGFPFALVLAWPLISPAPASSAPPASRDCG